MFLLAKTTGWPEQFLLWELPLTRALAYQHAAMRAEGVWTVSPSDQTAITTTHLSGFFSEDFDTDPQS